MRKEARPAALPAAAPAHAQKKKKGKKIHHDDKEATIHSSQEYLKHKKVFTPILDKINECVGEKNHILLEDAYSLLSLFVHKTEEIGEKSTEKDLQDLLYKFDNVVESLNELEPSIGLAHHKKYMKNVLKLESEMQKMMDVSKEAAVNVLHIDDFEIQNHPHSE